MKKDFGKIKWLVVFTAAVMLAVTPVFAADVALISVQLPSIVIPIGGNPSGIAAADDGTLWMTDVSGKAIWTWDGEELLKVCGASADTDLLGDALGGNADGDFKEASFRAPYAIAAYQDGFAVSDTQNGSVRLLKDNTVTTICSDFSRPTGLACDGDGNLYVADRADNAVYLLDADGALDVFLGGEDDEETLNQPMGLHWYNGTLYIADAGNHRILAVSGNEVSVFAGGVQDETDEGEVLGGSYRNGSVENAGFSSPQGVFACAEGVYVADSGNGALRLIQNGIVSTVKTNSELYPASPRGMAELGGRLFVCDQYAQTVFTVPLVPAVPSFGDVAPDNPNFDAITGAALYGIMAGGSNNLFNPNQSVTRADFLTALGNFNTAVYPYEVIAGESAFDDVAEDAYYSNAVAWGKDNALISGIGGGLFAPNNPVTLESAAVILFHYAQYAGYDTSGTAQHKEQASAWAEDAVSWAVSEGLISFDAELKGTMTRAQTAQLFWDFWI